MLKITLSLIAATAVTAQFPSSFGAENGCPKDKYRTCPDGTILERDPAYGCDFAPCPTAIEGIVDVGSKTYTPIGGVAGPLPPSYLPSTGAHWLFSASSSSGTCAGHCGVKDPAANCWCDNACALHGDCCSDHATVCKASIGNVAKLSGNVQTMSCSNNCGLESKSALGSCWCDALCEKNGDCCADYKTSCAATGGIIGDTGLGNTFNAFAPFAPAASSTFSQFPAFANLVQQQQQQQPQQPQQPQFPFLGQQFPGMQQQQFPGMQQQQFPGQQQQFPPMGQMGGMGGPQFGGMGMGGPQMGGMGGPQGPQGGMGMGGPQMGGPQMGGMGGPQMGGMGGPQMGGMGGPMPSQGMGPQGMGRR
jgi:hypothetical protein